MTTALDNDFKNSLRTWEQEQWSYGSAANENDEPTILIPDNQHFNIQEVSLDSSLSFHVVSPQSRQTPEKAKQGSHLPDLKSKRVYLSHSKSILATVIVKGF